MFRCFFARSCPSGRRSFCSSFLGHSKSGVYVCKYADVCLRHAAARRTSDDATSMKMLIFKVNRFEPTHERPETRRSRSSKENKRQRWFEKDPNYNRSAQRRISPVIVPSSRQKKPMSWRNNSINLKFAYRSTKRNVIVRDTFSSVDLSLRIRRSRNSETTSALFTLCDRQFRSGW